MSLLTPPPRGKRMISSGTRTRSSIDRLAPARDTGIKLRGTDERARRRRAAKKRARIEVAVVVGAALIALLGGWRATVPTERIMPGQTVAGAQPTAEQVAVKREDLSDPTPFFGSYRSLHLYLPIQVASLTELAFHQASGNIAIPIESLLPDADMDVVTKNHGSGRAESTATAGPTVLTGSVLRMWRSNRSGAPDTAADIGALPGTRVFAPVTGTVVQVRAYKLYEKYDDYEIHIQPNGWPEVDVVIIHVDTPTVKAGDHVIGGISSIAVVRKLSDRVTPQISAYTKDAGDHVHLQLNRIAVPGKLNTIDGS
ncbi:MAG: M23 family metallopeptidase [Coriobacteriia bacterium]|nr:M23 family metallopeptidase [Coriobacteriia bacterium]